MNQCLYHQWEAVVSCKSTGMASVNYYYGVVPVRRLEVETARMNRADSGEP